MDTGTQKYYLKIGFSPDLSGFDRIIYRLLEIFPGALTWATLGGIVFASAFSPAKAAYFIILFDVYWLAKTVFLSFHLRANVARMKHNLSIDWEKRLETIQWQHLWHVVVLPMSTESIDVVRETMQAIATTSWPKDRLMVMLSFEERYHTQGEIVAQQIKHEFFSQLPYLFTTMHPAGRLHEIPGKGSNESWAARIARDTLIDPMHIPYENIIVSSLDIDTRIYPQYFHILAWHFSHAPHPFRSSYQPVPIFNNNIWDAHALSRVVATSGTFWQMMQQERPERLTTFSSHAMSWKALYELNYWQTNIVSEDSRIFWNAFLLYDGAYESVPLSYPISMDANMSTSLLQTIKNVYRQQRRWAWGVENFPYVAFGFIKNKAIPLRKKIYYLLIMLEGYWSWSTNALLIFALGWLPVIIGGNAFNKTVLAYNLPYVTRIIMTLAMIGLITSAITSFSLLPPCPKKYKKIRSLGMALQWLFVPVTIIVFGSIPAIEAQTRLMLGKYMGFWITPKHRSK